LWIVVRNPLVILLVVLSVVEFWTGDIRAGAVMAAMVFLINGLTKHNWKEAFFFSMVVAVGLTPEMLPMIVSVWLSKGAPDVILLETSLMVLEEGVLEGRKVFINILRYIRMGASSNFGNMSSVLDASAFMPYVPIQVLTNNLLYDFSQVPIPIDCVGPDLITKPRPWVMGEIARYIMFIGPISSIFDDSTYFMMLYIFKCWNSGRASLFQTGWFVESLMTQTLIIHVIRTNKIPFLQTRASWPLTLTTIAIMLVGAWLLYSPLAGALGFVSLPALYWLLLLATLLTYMTLTQLVKMWLLRRG
jgi:P-type Mg2+ transporter